MKKNKFLWIAVMAGGIAIGLELAGWAAETFIYAKPAKTAAAGGVGEKTEAELERKIGLLKSRLSVHAPGGLYIVVDTAANRLYLKKKDAVIREVVVSCGSGDVLDEPGGKRRWIFDTPRGEFNVQNKLINPTWIKPDWAFIEEGEKPPRDYNARIDNDSLGDYALGFGDGFFIHGTLYTRLLGRNVTHGCIRVGDKDLKYIFESVALGSRIFIF
jgi:lipoprotein-anchoring transpeptidase ErfK/SrfK